MVSENSIGVVVKGIIESVGLDEIFFAIEKLKVSLI